MEIKISLRGNPASGSYPNCRIRLNSYLLKEITIMGDEAISLTVDLLDQNILQIEHFGKTNRDTKVGPDGKIIEDRSLELVGIMIAGIEILPTVLNMQKFYVSWPANIIRDHERRNERPPEFLINNLYFGFNGIYEMRFLGDPIKLHYEQLWLDEVQAHHNLTKVKDGMELFDRPDGLAAINRDFDLTIYDLERLINS